MQKYYSVDKLVVFGPEMASEAILKHLVSKTSWVMCA